MYVAGHRILLCMYIYHFFPSSPASTSAYGSINKALAPLSIIHICKLVLEVVVAVVISVTVVIVLTAVHITVACSHDNSDSSSNICMHTSVRGGILT